MSTNQSETDEDSSGVLPLGTSTGSRRRERRGRGLPGCLAVLVVLALIGVGLYLGATKGVQALKDQFSNPADYPGPGSGKITIQVHGGDTATDIGNTLKDKGVVESVGAFTDAAKGNAASAKIQPGFYGMKKQMSAADALAILIDPKNSISKQLLIPEGFRVTQIVDRLVAEAHFKRAAVQALIDRPAQIGLPAEAKGNVEGYLYPSTYPVTPGETPKTLLSMMVQKTVSTEKSLGIESKARPLGLTPYQVLIVASILEKESNKPADAAKVARVLYNRLKIDMRLQLDSTVAYFTKKTGSVYTTQEDRDTPNPYNTYLNTGLPPGPIGSAGDTTIQAALNPAKGSWLYFIADPTTNTTLFSDTFDEQQQNAAVVAQHCRDSPTKC